jgi:arylsulfatase A-like enzyme
MKTRLSIIAVLLIVTSLAVLGAFNFSSDRGRPNIVLISLDTLRADRLSSYGYARATSPTIDALAQQSALFENAITPAPWTLPAHVSMLSGLYPHSHGVVQPRGSKISDSVPLLAELLKAHNYATIAVTAKGYLAKSYGFDRGFDQYAQLAPPRKNIRDSVALATAEIKRVPQGKPFLLFLHTYDLHCPYTPPRRFLHRFKSEDAEEIDTSQCGSTFYNTQQVSWGQAQYISDRYDESILAVDEGLKRLFAYLESRSDRDNTIIIITSDHGEEFLEHGQIGHQGSLHRELLFVPLIIKVPGKAARRVSQEVSLIDITPTILALTGISAPSTLDGVSLLPLIEGSGASAPTRDFQYSELDRGEILRSRIDSSSHLILNISTKTHAFFDLQNDPFEIKSVVAEQPEQFEEAYDQLMTFIDKAKVKAAAPLTETHKQLRQLESLGYLQ